MIVTLLSWALLHPFNKWKECEYVPCRRADRTSAVGIRTKVLLMFLDLRPHLRFDGSFLDAIL